MDPIWQYDLIKMNEWNEWINLHEIRYTEVFEVADAKTRDAKILSNSDLVFLR